MDCVTKQPKTLRISRAPSGVLMCILIALIVGFWTGCSQEPPPKYVIGSWMSPDERFEGRVLTITPTGVEITIHGESVAFYVITRSQVVHEKGWMKVMLNLEDLQQKRSNMMFNYNSQRDTLWLENRPDVIWHRSKNDTLIYGMIRRSTRRFENTA